MPPLAAQIDSVEFHISRAACFAAVEVFCPSMFSFYHKTMEYDTNFWLNA
jgi:hypothetical protein